MRETAEYLKVTEQAIRDYIASGQLEASKLGRIWRVSESDIAKFLEKMKPKRTQMADVEAEDVEEKE